MVVVSGQKYCSTHQMAESKNAIPLPNGSPGGRAASPGTSSNMKVFDRTTTAGIGDFKKMSRNELLEYLREKQEPEAMPPP